ncbi:MAG: hypothetical protein IT393_04660 [Nitrospirae bacterium]|nr:hypothetical protein [Nitrospirota bacterium]
MKLMIFYEYAGSTELVYKCLDIENDDEPAKAVDDFIKCLRGWGKAKRFSLSKDPQMPEPGFVACYMKDEKGGNRAGSARKKLTVSFHVREEKKAAPLREEFCSFVDALQNDSPEGRKTFKEAANSPEVHDFEVEYLTEFLLMHVRRGRNNLLQ